MHETQEESQRRLRLFLCHSTADKSAVRALYRKLRNDGFHPWLDEEKILPGQDWEHEIKKAVRGADVVVNTDADNQYEAADIPALIEPILAGRADLVLGDRDVAREEFFSPAKRILQKVGSGVLSLATGVKVPDATSGFRAFSRGAASRVLVLSKYSYTLETLIQAAALKQRIAFVPIRTNPPTRPSRLMRSQFDYVRRSAAIILRSFALYHPVKSLLTSAGVLSSMAIAGMATDIDEMVVLAAIFQSLALVGFAPLYKAHRAVLCRVERQAGSIEQTTTAQCVPASSG